MFIPASYQNVPIDFLEILKQRSSTDKTSAIDVAALSKNIIEESIGGILILTEKRELIHANSCAQRMLRLFDHRNTAHLIPDEIWHLCQTLIASRNLFPAQQWLMNSKIFVDSTIAFQVEVRWFNSDTWDYPCLLLFLQDNYQLTRYSALEEAQRFDLTSRETEVWLLHRANYSYKQIAIELQITLNTVKKHMKSIYIKQKLLLPDEQ